MIQITNVNADSNSEIRVQCQREAEEYGIEPEQRDDYINGCILSMGGAPVADQNVETQDEETPEAAESPEATAAPEGEDSGDAQ
jgi:hypothetical protein